MTHYETTIARIYSETAKVHKVQHADAEHLDGAVPVVVCTGCDERFGYHVGHAGDWRTCEEGYCSPSGTLYRDIV